MWVIPKIILYHLSHIILAGVHVVLMKKGRVRSTATLPFQYSSSSPAPIYHEHDSHWTFFG